MRSLIPNAEYAMTHQQIAKAMNLNLRSVQDIEQRALKKLARNAQFEQHLQAIADMKRPGSPYDEERAA